MVELVLTENVLKIIVAVLSMAVAILLHLRRSASTSGNRCNHSIQLDNPKVVDKVGFTEIEELPSCKKNGTAVFCRCWKSKNFPYCDGSHATHNRETGDNVGPLIIAKDK
ncbi:CDGSH iron sulfur domain-containing protein 1 [Tribonema minus]|uniref:CDGSH iron sulfur domain-containing protein 1 n=1 Tax=Tribonema minus TaxID=303371 RepID=A0A835YNQ0_9STRA|nr:CDGSH iron sulfur domain-containing protein 1 [Tribonema minus]|eukprot:TRINITY_DN6244_c0_g1_i1.p3 TRINITY_DN6244_c0_g1~~TRINITY_DN6244_c0_g1_i1.p3  ORF type:complete len:110 (+),score=26.05 TRINITY_DN6244_c0_g1_i1:102-431(+)